jgi:hypothetical protein
MSLTGSQSNVKNYIGHASPINAYSKPHNASVSPSQFLASLPNQEGQVLQLNSG